MDRELQSYSIVVEMENARSIDWDEICVALSALAREVETATRQGYSPQPEIILVHGGEEADTPLLERNVAELVPQLGIAADLRFHAVPGGRYYELKNEGTRLAAGDIVVFSDSDCVPEDGCLSALLKPFKDNRGTIAVNGHTYLGYDDFASRTFALIWLFPLRDHDRRFASRRALNANNCAFRRDWIASHPYPANNGFKVSCTLLTRQLQDSGQDFVRVEARASHCPPRGWRFFVWRALVTGRDADRKYLATASPSRLQRVLKSFGKWGTMSWRVLRRVVAHAHDTGMPFWQIPLALIVGLAFYTLAFLAQMTMALGLIKDEVEYLPAYVEHS